MILQTKDFKEAAKTILFAIDNKETSLITETLELKAEGTVLNLNVTNREYYVTTKFNLSEPENLTAAVSANLFLNLISKVTSDTIEITVDGNVLKIKANGNYKLPMIYNNDKLLELPEININNITNEFDINSDILHSITAYNSKELLRGVPARPVQKYYYIDESGAITFTAGACVNTFSLEKPVKMLLSDKVVRLFKLFKPDSKVEFKMGQDEVTEDIIQTKVKFSTNNVSITAKLSDSGLVSSVPVSNIRAMADKTYDYSVVINKDELLGSIQRILLFQDMGNLDNTYGIFEFNSDTLKVFDYSKENQEEVSIKNKISGELTDPYTMAINLGNFKLVLDGVEDEFVTINFGDKRAVVVKKLNISDIVPELVIK